MATFLYTGSITVSASTTIKAVALAPGFTVSDELIAAYTLNCATPVASPVAGTYGSAQSVDLTCATAGSAIHYTTDGSTPTSGSTLYTGTISVSASETVKAIGIASGLGNSSVLTAAYVISGAATPTVVNSNVFTGSNNISASISPSAGNLLVVAFCGNGSNYTSHSVEDNIDGATGWNLICGNNASGNNLSYWYKKNIPAGITTITALSAVADAALVIHEVNGASATTPFTTGEFSTTAYTSATTNPQAGAIATSAPNSLILAAMSNNGNPPVGINGTGTTGTWNLFSSGSHNDNSSPFEILSVVNIAATSPGGYVHGWTVASQAAQTTCAAAFHG